MNIICKSFSLEEFKVYLNNVKFDSWRPSFAVVHNTSEPDQKMYRGWHNKSNWTQEQWMRNLASYYKGMGWSGCPHLFVAYDCIMVLNALNVRGTHSPSWNNISWGIETVGEFEDEVFDDATRNNLVGALAALHSKIGLDPNTIKFHKEDPKTTHKSCPGRNINKHQLINDVINIMNSNENSHVHISENAQIAETSELTDEEMISVKWLQSKLNVEVDGIIGPITRKAIKDFQQKYGLVVDGIAGPITRKTVKKYLG